MRITKLQLKNFKRFTDLEINFNINENFQAPKMVLLIGANGSGKSCIFDAFEIINKVNKSTLLGNLLTKADGLINAQTFAKNNSNKFVISLNFDDSGRYNLLQEGSHTAITKDKSLDDNFFYGRTAFRYTPKITKTTFGSTSKSYKDEDRPLDYTEYDTKRFENDWDKFLLEQVYAYGENNPNVKSEFINIINQAFSNIFGLNDSVSLRYKDFKLPAEGVPLRFIFQKGKSEINYDQLSAGEKMVFELLFNLLARKSLYPEGSIVFMDEVDLHLNTALQENLLKEINENWLGKNQLWLASHSLGFIEYARKTDTSVLIDLDNLDFDATQIIVPKIDNSLDVFDVAVPKQLIFDIFDSKKIILCENQNDAYYNSLNFENIIFVGVKDKYTVIHSVNSEKRYFGLIDRDYLTDQERKDATKDKHLYILEMYSFENYLYHPDNLEELDKDLELKDWNKTDYIQSVIQKKNANLLEIGGSLQGRKNYTLLNKDSEKETKERESIIQDLKSDNFEVFYKHFNLKKYRKPDLNLTVGQLTSTKWFKTNIAKIIL